MSLALDERQRAMLAEMGIRLFQPEPGAAGLPPEPARPAAPRPAVAAGPAVAPDLVAVRAQPMRAVGQFSSEEQAVTSLAPGPAGIELMEWDALAQTVAACRACSLCNGRRNAVFGVG